MTNEEECAGEGNICFYDCEECEARSMEASALADMEFDYIYATGRY